MTQIILDEATKEASKTPEANIIFIGKREFKGDLRPAVAPSSIIDGQDRIKLPSSADQVKGFYHENAAQIIRAFPKLYKQIKRKGVK
jgi:hypothetical protein